MEDNQTPSADPLNPPVPPPERVFVAIDGSNLYGKLHDPEIAASNLLLFDYSGLAQWLAGPTRVIVSKVYYVGVVRAEQGNAKSEQMRRNQQRLFSHLTNTGWKVERGFLMKNGNKYHEKGVDVKIAVDIVAGAHKNSFDTAILISSDSDLVPAAQEAKGMGKRVEYIGFSHRPSIALVKNASNSRLLVRADIDPFVAHPSGQLLPPQGA
jgi:uncharacterized LabA/DUF88 family protein